MPLAHFKTPEYLTKSEIVFTNLVEVNFDGHQILNDMITSISGNKIIFNLNELEDGRIEPLQTIYKLINNEDVIEKVTISFHNKEGKIQYTIKITDLEFKKIVDLCDFDYMKSGIKFVEVEFDYVGEPKIEFPKK